MPGEKNITHRTIILKGDSVKSVGNRDKKIHKEKKLLDYFY